MGAAVDGLSVTVAVYRVALVLIYPVKLAFLAKDIAHIHDQSRLRLNGEPG